MIRFIFTWLFLSWLWLFTSCSSHQKKDRQNPSYVFYLGTYTDGESQGIYKYLLTKNGEIKLQGLQAKTPNPSFLAINADHRFLLAVNENNPGTVSVFAVKADTLHFINRQYAGGDAPCYLAINPNGWVLTANYGSGTVGLHKIGSSGQLSPLLDSQKHRFNNRQPHAHSVLFYPKSQQIISADLGTNQLWFSRLDTLNEKIIAGEQNPLEMPTGSGPRHMVLHPNLPILYVANELGNTVSVIEKAPDSSWKLLNSYSTLPDGFKETNYVADLHLSPDNRFLYVSNRGSNTLAIFNVSNDGKKLKLIDFEPVHGNWPRNFALTPDGRYLLVANQKSNNLSLFLRDNSTGKLKFISKIKAASPVFILFYSN